MNKPITISPTAQKAIDFSSNFATSFANAVPGNVTEKITGAMGIPQYNIQSKAGQAGNVVGNIASNMTQGVALGGVLKPVFGVAQKPLGGVAGKLIAKGGVGNKILGKGVANISQGLPYTASFNLLNKANNPQTKTGGNVLADVGFDFATGMLPIVGVAGMAARKGITSNADDIAKAIKKNKPADLISEARKYKSADEFVNSYNLYHGTPAEIEGGALKFGAGKQPKKGGYMGGHFLTNEPDIANEFSFGGKVYQASGDIKNKVLDVNANKKLFRDYIGKKFKNSDGDMEVFTKDHYDFMFPDGGNADWATVYTDLANQLAKERGKIGIAIPEYAGGKEGVTYQLFEDNIPIYTKSQLTDIWNKANLSKGADGYLYHGTNEDVLDSIAKDGLKPMNRGLLSLSKDESYAKSFAREGITPQGKTNPVMLRVNENLLNGKAVSSNKPRPASDELNEVLTKEVIPPEALEIYKNGKWQPLTDIWNKAQGVKALKAKGEAQKKLKDLMTYQDRLIKEKGISPIDANKIGYKKGMEILNQKVGLENSVETIKKAQIEQPLKTQPQVSEASLQDSLKRKPLLKPTELREKNFQKIGQLQSDTGKEVSQTPYLSQKLEQSRAQAQTSNKSTQVGYPSFEEIIQRSGIDVKTKVNHLDYLRTPDRVLKKIGLEKESKLIRKAYDNYLTELPKEIDKVTAWAKQVSPEANQKIFKYLDGQRVSLSTEELRVANEIKGYLGEWADRLGLPKDKRIANYITHIFEEDFIKKEFDPDIAKLIRDRVAGSVYDPFLEQRLGKMGYVEDTWKALDAYVKRATRKANIDPVLDQMKPVVDGLEESQFDYVKSYIDRINLRPAKEDNLLDNGIKQILGYRFGQRPVARITRGIRQAAYRGTLGLNVGSALRNLTQGVNTYAELGEKYTVIGYTKLAKSILSKSDELERVGVLRNNFIEDRTVSATKKFVENLDKGLFSLFEFAERINRGSAYFGAKAKAIAKGMSEEQAIEYGKDVVRKTQFTFGSVDTPLFLQKDIAKLFTQFQSFNIKQTEFLAEKIQSKDFAGLARYIFGSIAVVATIGEIMGLDIGEMIPFSGVATGETKLGQTPAVAAGGVILNRPDKYGNKAENLEDYAKNLWNAAVPFIPAGSQIRKTYQGIKAGQQGYSATKSGGAKFLVPENRKLQTAVFGQYSTPEAQEYFKEDRRPLSTKQTELLKQTDDKEAVYNEIMQTRVANAEENKVREAVRESGQAQTVNEKFMYYDSESEQVKSINMNPDLTPPQLTGQKELDKEILSDYKSSLSRRINDIVKLYELGQMSSEEAEKEIAKISVLKEIVSQIGKSSKPKKIRVSRGSTPKTRKTSVKKVSLKTIKRNDKAKFNVKVKKPTTYKVSQADLEKLRTGNV